MAKHEIKTGPVAGETVAIEPAESGVLPLNALADVPRVNEVAGARLSKIASVAPIVAAAGGLLCLLGLFLSPGTWFQSYLFGFMFWFGITVGSTGWLMGHHVTGGGWGYILRRSIEASTRIWPWVLGMWVPIAVAAFLSSLVDPHGFALHERPIYEWANLNFLLNDPVLNKKFSYLNLWTWLARALVFFAIMFGLAAFLNKWSRREDVSDDPIVRHKLSMWSAFGLVLLLLSVTMVTIDWVMTLEPHWFSSLWGAIFLIGQGQSTIAVMIILIRYLAKDSVYFQKIETRYLRDLGNLMLAFTLLWAYTNYSQFMIQYSGNIAEEAEWFVHRTTFGWQWWGMANIILHFALPFLFLLMSINKVNPNNLVKVAALLVFARFFDLFFYIVPTFRVSPLSGLPGGEAPLAFLADLGAPLLLGGLWLWAWAGQMKKANAPVVPLFDERLRPYWPLADAHEEAHGVHIEERKVPAHG